MRERIHYIDVAKGILIMLVVFDHIPDMFFVRLGGANNSIRMINEMQWVYKCFFMPAFFILTGYCSSFNAPFKPFIIKNFKSLVIPGIVIGLFDCLFNPNCTIRTIFFNIIHDGGFYWFLVALFEAKIIYYLLSKYIKDTWLIGIICLLLMLLGFAFNNLQYRYQIYYFYYSFSLVFYIYVGQLLKINNINMIWLVLLSVLFILTIALCYSYGHVTPQVVQGFENPVTDIPLSLLVSLSGSAFLLLVSKLICNNRILEFFGRNSLVFYTLEFSVIVSIEYVLLNDFCLDLSTTKGAVLFVFVTFVFTLIVLSMFTRLLRTKRLKWVLGGF